MEYHDKTKKERKENNNERKEKKRTRSTALSKLERQTQNMYAHCLYIHQTLATALYTQQVFKSMPMYSW